MESRYQRSVIAKAKRLGALAVKVDASQNGWPDLEILLNGITTHIEMKDDGESPSPLQLAVHEQIRAHGGRVVVMVGKQTLEQVRAAIV